MNRTQKGKKTQQNIYSIFFYCNKFLQSQYNAPIFYLHKKVLKSRIKKGSSINNQKRFVINGLKRFLNQGTFTQKIFSIKEHLHKKVP